MKKLFYCSSILLIFLSMSFTSLSVNAQSSSSWNKKNAAKWFEKREWLTGLKQLKPNSSINQTEFAKQYHANKIWWDEAFAFLREHDLDSLKTGKYLIDGNNVFATVSEGPPRRSDTSKFESHRNYQDIQYVIKGKSKIEVAPVSSATVITAYNEPKDITFYTAKGRYYIADSSSFFIFFPQDAHRPNLKMEGYDVVKRIVIKVRRRKL